MFAAKFRVISLSMFMSVALPAISAGEEGTSPPADYETTVITLDLWVLTLRGPEKSDTTKPLKPFATRVANQIKTIGGRDGVEGLLARLQEQGMLGRLQNFRVTTIGGAEATIVCGERAATVTGVTMSDRGQSTNIIYQQIGTVVKLTPIVNPEGTIQVAMSFNRSELAPSPDTFIARPAGGDPTAATNVPSMTVETKVKIAPGGATLATMSSDSEHDEATLLILAAATDGVASVTTPTDHD